MHAVLFPSPVEQVVFFFKELRSLLNQNAGYNQPEVQASLHP
jgi:hypothetical protein